MNSKMRGYGLCIAMLLQVNSARAQPEMNSLIGGHGPCISTADCVYRLREGARVPDNIKLLANCLLEAAFITGFKTAENGESPAAAAAADAELPADEAAAAAATALPPEAAAAAAEACKTTAQRTHSINQQSDWRSFSSVKSRMNLLASSHTAPCLSTMSCQWVFTGAIPPLGFHVTTELHAEAAFEKALQLGRDCSSRSHMQPQGMLQDRA